MLTFIIRRVILIPVVVFGCILLVFGMMQLLSPAKRLALYIDNPNELKQLSENLDVMIHRYGLDRPIYVQFTSWFGQVLRGDLGWSESAARPVSGAFRRFLPVSAELALWSALPIVLGGILLGSASAVRHNKLFDHVTRVFAIVGWSLPTFVAGLLALFLFYGILEWFPPGQIGIHAAAAVRSADFTSYTGMVTLDAVLNGNWFVFADAMRHIVLPVIVLSLVSWAMLLRITRASMLETLRQDYVTTARAKGLRERVVIRRHARRNALIAPITVAGITVAFLFNGLVITETIFDFHGLGRWAARAAQTFDLPALLGYLLFNGVLIVMANLVVDVLYAQIDPRVRLE
jgi:ABC-type dipeptide/oligopeptide/nickel transport system permease component